MGPVAAPACSADALDMLRAAMGYLTGAVAPQMAAAEQARCLLGLEQVQAMGTAARTAILAAFGASRNYAEDTAAYSVRGWLIHRARVTRGTAGRYLAWVRRAGDHARVLQAMAAGGISESYAETICAWSDKLPEGCRADADDILLAAAAAGADLADLAGLAAEMYARSRPADDDDPGRTLDDRAVSLIATFDGAGVLAGSLTPECAAVVRAVLDALSAPRDAGDGRSHEQRYHDALHEAMQRLIAAGLLPERAGQPAKVLAHIPLQDLLDLDTGSAAQRAWARQAQARWAAARAAAAEGGSDGGAWLDGQAAEGFACDASVTPVVTGAVNVEVFDDLVGLCLELARHRAPVPALPAQRADRSRDELEQAIIGKAAELMAGPGGLAGFLRRRLLDGRLGGPSLPLDVGVSRDIPAAIRRAVILRDQHCRFPGGCDQPAAACEVHHLTHKADGGKTSVKDCALFCFYHHHVVIHQLGWTVTLNPDGTATARSPDGSTVLYDKSPPARAG